MSYIQELIDYVIQNLNYLIYLFLFVVFINAIYFGYKYYLRQKTDIIVSNDEFRKFIEIHALVFFLSVIYESIRYVSNHFDISILSVFLYLLFIIKITHAQNKETNGYITDGTGMSGVLFFVSATTLECLTIIISLFAIAVMYVIYWFKEHHIHFSSKICSYVFDILEALVLILINMIAQPSNIIQYAFEKAALISVFSVLLPCVRPFIIKRLTKNY